MSTMYVLFSVVLKREGGAEASTIDQLLVEKKFRFIFKTIVFNALIPNILLSRLSDEQKFIFFRI